MNKLNQDKSTELNVFHAKTISQWPILMRAAAVVGILLATAGGTHAREMTGGTPASLKGVPGKCPNGWVSSSAPGGCSPGFFTLKFVGISSTLGCPKGWVSSSAPGGCSPGFFTLKLNGARDSRSSCPDGWVRSSAPGGCSPDYLTLELARLQAINSCPSGWVRSSAPGGCSPDNFTLEPGFDGVDQARYHCAFGRACDAMIEAVLALGGNCYSEGPDTTCDIPPIPPLNEE